MKLSAEDRFAILDVIAQYNLAADEKDVEATLALYTEDGQIGGDMSTGKGKDAMRQDLPDIFAAEVTLKRHIASNIQFKERNGDKVEVGYILLVIEGGIVPLTVATSIITDNYRLVGEEWKVAKHHVAVDPNAQWMVKAGGKVQKGVKKVKEALS
ncbi:MAG: nuclear transport factor 2 family protein [Phormidesmis sp.]